MERKKVSNEVNPIPAPKLNNQKLRWQKVGGGSLRITLSGIKKIIKPNEKFEAYLDEIPKAFKDQIIPLQPLPESVNAPVVKSIPVVYTIEPIDSEGLLFNIIDSQGKVFNETPLDEETAKQFVKDIS
jgi:hypothetical protein